LAEELALKAELRARLLTWRSAFLRPLGHLPDPRDDLISGLLQAQIEGQHLTLPELLGFCSLLLVAGNETTTNLIGNALLCFTEHREAWAQLRDQPALLPQAIEEVLRFRSPVQSMFRVASTNAKLGDQSIPARASMECDVRRGGLGIQLLPANEAQRCVSFCKAVGDRASLSLTFVLSWAKE
jgi:cytochrome P450